MQGNKSVKGEQSLCYKCVRAEKGCEQASDRMFTCQGHLTAKDKEKNIQRVQDLAWLVKTPQFSRVFKQDIDENVHEQQPFTGNSETAYNLGERGHVMKKALILLEILDLDSTSDLIIYLHNTIKGAR